MPAPTNLDRLIAQALSLPPCQLREYLERFVGRPETARAGLRISERRLSTERLPDRNAEIRQRHTKGESYGQLSMDYGISPSGIAKIVQRGRRKSMDAVSVSIANIG